MKAKIIFFGFALLLASCSRPTSGAPKDACKMMSKQTAESTLDVELSEPKFQNFGENPRQPVISYCQYESHTDGLKSVVFTIRSGGLPAAATNPAVNFISTMKQTFGERYDLKKLSNLGDGAVWDDSLHQLTVFQGTNTYVWTSPGASSADLEQKFVALAKKTVPAL